jgi:peptidoglycan/xylan/chitin deacetylase (PgdA/CDA1 family)
VRIPILLYHAIGTGADARFAEWEVAPELFASHLALLARCDYEVLTVRDLAERGMRAERAVVVTFDDGFADFHDEAWPLLRRYGFPATVFVTSGFVGGTSGWLHRLGEERRPMLDAAQIAELAGAGIEIGAHGHEHLQLDTVSERAAWADITASKASLEALAGPVTSFAYPHGYNTARVRRQVARAGFTAACAVGDGMATEADDRFAMTRIVVRGGTTDEALERLLDSEPPARRPVRRAAWRAVRRAGAEPMVQRLAAR